MLTHNDNVHVRRWELDQPKVFKFLLLSDLHWDNPKCDRALLTHHLDQAKTLGARVGLNGDTLCLMQGLYDPRKSKSSIRPEHNYKDYLDRVLDTAIEYFTPYAHLIDFIGEGNHESSVSRRQETDILNRLVKGLNQANDTNIGRGGYGGWWVNRFKFDSKNYVSHRLKYFHGSGGGGPVTKGTIQHNRALTKYAGADLIWMGHVHENYELDYQVEFINRSDIIQHKKVLMVRTATYKEEYTKGKGGWHVERGAAVKPLGGRWLELHVSRGGINQRTYSTLKK